MLGSFQGIVGAPRRGFIAWGTVARSSNLWASLIPAMGLTNSLLKRPTIQAMEKLFSCRA